MFSLAALSFTQCLNCVCVGNLVPNTQCMLYIVLRLKRSAKLVYASYIEKKNKTQLQPIFHIGFFSFSSFNGIFICVSFASILF